MGANFSLLRFAATALVLMGSWYVLSGKHDPMYLGVGLLSALVLGATLPGWKDGLSLRPAALLLYLPWLVWQILLSNLRVARAVLQPRLAIEPTFVRAEPALRGQRALTTLGVSLTLTPGTLTVEVDEERIFVHALDARSAHDTREGLIAERVRGLYAQEAP